MKSFFCILIVILINSPFFSQSYFSVIPDFGGDEMEGRLYNVIPLENEIKLIGLVHDSIVPGFDGGTWPILGSISYNGEYKKTHYLVDSLYTNGFYYFTKRLVYKTATICYLYDRRDIGATFLDAYLIEVNLTNGKILRSKIIYDEVSNNEDFFGEDITIDNQGNIYLINVTTQAGPHSQVLTVLDSNFNLLAQKIIPNYGRDNFTKYTEIDDNGNIILVGVSQGAPNSVWFESKLFRQVLDKDYNSVEFNLANTTVDPSVIASDSYSIIKAENGDWICASQVVEPIFLCQDCSIGIPYIVCVSNDFKEVRWETRMFDGNINSSETFFSVNSITEVNDGYIFAGSTDGTYGSETSGLLGKVGINGDSLWLKHYIPIGWDTIQGRWFFLQDIKTAPNGNIVVGGHGSDRYTSRILPWILYLDSDGCIDPGCNTVSTDNIHDLNDIAINIFPNPASNQCSIHVKTSHSASSHPEFVLVSNSGQVIKRTRLAGNDVEFLLDLKNFPAGVYFAQILDEGVQLASKEFVVSK